MALKNNTWKLNQWYDQDVAGNVEYTSSSHNFWTWGENERGMLGQNTPVTTDKSSPTQIPGATNWSSLGGGWYDTQCSGAVRADGTMWTWGRNIKGSLGLNQAAAQLDNRSSPVQVPGTSWSQISVRNDNMMAIRTDGTLWGWGDAGSGETATNTEGTSGTRSSPTQVPGSTWSSLGSHYGGWGAIKTDGTLWMWGNNAKGNLAQNNRTQRSSPVQVPGTTWSKLSQVSYELAVGAIKTDGTLWVWGANEYGGLGQNGPTNTDYSSPVQIPGSWSHINTQYNGSGVKTDGTLWWWGNNEYGQGGQNNKTQYSSPVQIGSGTDWSTSVSSFSNTFATKTDGTLWVLGRNRKGVLGLNEAEDAVYYSSPVQLPGFSGNKLTISSINTDGLAVLEQL